MIYHIGLRGYEGYVNVVDFRKLGKYLNYQSSWLPAAANHPVCEWLIAENHWCRGNFIDCILQTELFHIRTGDDTF